MSIRLLEAGQRRQDKRHQVSVPPMETSTMAPRTGHKKTRTGCKRCKARKVKCDEIRPRCGACTRHRVHCEYLKVPYGDPPSLPYTASPAGGGGGQADHLMEMRLMHEWMAFTCMSLSVTWEFWKFRVPLLAFEFRYLLDALLAITALYSSRQGPRYWSAREGKLLTSEKGQQAPPGAGLAESAAAPTGWKMGTTPSNSNSSSNSPVPGQPGSDYIISVNPHSRQELLEVSRKYFDAALEGHQKAVASLTPENFKAAYLCSILVSYYALFSLSEDAEAPDSLQIDIVRWFVLARGTIVIIDRWRAHAGDRWFLEADGMYGEPDMTNEEELFRPEHRENFNHLLAPVGDDAIVDEKDREAYERTLSYIGMLYKGIVFDLDSPLGTGRRLIAMPSRVPPRFSELVEAGHARALAILAHAFATLKLAEERYPWFEGIAQRQVPAICALLPASWVHMVRWPLEIAQTTSEPART